MDSKRSVRIVPRLKDKFIVDSKGKKIGVILDVAEYEEMLKAQEELESIKAYDKAKASGDEVIPFEQAIDEIERKR